MQFESLLVDLLSTFINLAVSEVDDEITCGSDENPRNCAVKGRGSVMSFHCRVLSLISPESTVRAFFEGAMVNKDPTAHETGDFVGETTLVDGRNGEAISNNAVFFKDPVFALIRYINNTDRER
ncbi:MAG: hypothetical protein JRF28_09265 [Deltaproteobacteria bacterium]|nr:hypothetical protein [Deltaproteobacteria bacterium]